jgi:hypothetical protein
MLQILSGKDALKIDSKIGILLTKKDFSHFV